MALSMRQELKAVSQKVQIFQSENGTEGYSKRFILPPNFLAFQGHFPDHPILPGIVQIMMGEIAISEVLQAEYTVKEVKQGKFLKPIEPNHDLCIKIFLIKKDTWDCEIHTDTLASRFRLLCETSA